MFEDLSDLKQGDNVIVCYRGVKRTAEIEKITPKGFIKVGGALFDKNGLMRGGDSWHRKSLEKATKEKIESIQRNETIGKAKRLMETTIPTYEQALKILEIL